MWGTWGSFPLAVAMVVAVMTLVVFCAKATEKCNEITKTSFLLTIILSITICCKTYCSSRTANCSVAQAQVGARPEPKPLWSNGPRHIGYRRKHSYHCENNSHIVLRPIHRNNEENENRSYTTYLRLLIILDFWLF
jgi:hypothetical protein